MKKRLQMFALTLALMAFGTANAGITICYTDAGGFNYVVNAELTGFKYYTISGEIDLGTGELWEITGYWDIWNKDYLMVWTNPSPDGCVLYVDGLEFTITGGFSGYMDWAYYQFCDGVPLSDPIDYPVNYDNGVCPGPPVRLAGPSIASVGYDPSVQQELINNFEKTSVSLFDLLVEAELSANRMGNGFVFSSNQGIEAGSELLIYNHVGQVISTAYATSDNMIVWDGNSTNGTAAQNGMYIAVLRNGENQTTVKFIK